MLKIGITGGIGSGKTTVCKLFELQNIPVFYADEQARLIMHTDELLVEQIKSRFGADIYSPQGSLNRSKLASMVFNNDENLKDLNALVHPAIFRVFDSWVAKQRAPYVLKEAALLFESGSYKNCDQTILVKSPKSLKIARVMKRDLVPETEVLRRMEKQLGDDEKEKIADFVIHNDEKQLVIPQMLKLHDIFLHSSLVVK